jgi:hypothetical protein
MSNWMPIETAPEDGRNVLVYAPSCYGLDEIIGIVGWHKDAGYCIDEVRQVTHWMPLPEPPNDDLDRWRHHVTEVTGEQE